MIQVGDWRIVRHDERNLETMHFHGSKRGYGDGTPKWHKTGNYFQSVHAAVEFIIKSEIRSEAGDEGVVRTLAEFLEDESALLQEFRTWLAEIDSARV